jgi:ABC-type lipoprotein release transport system permease subunit
MLVALAWRNIWRNRRRTLITLAALSLGSFGIVAMHSFRESVFVQLAQNITAQLVGDIQIHGKGWQASPEIGNLVKDPIAIEAKLSSTLPDAKTEKRVLGAGLAGSKDNSAGVMIMGVQPGIGAGDLDVKKGAPLPAQAARTVVIGTGLAGELGVDVGGELVLVGQAADGSVANDRYTVAGLCDAGTEELNATAVFLHIKDAQDFFGLGDGVHELIVHLPPGNAEHEAKPLNALKTALDLRTVEAMSWNELLPELTGTIDAKRRGQYGMDFVIFLIVALGVLNAMTMATFERTREFGVMLALGTRPRRILALVVLEALLQGALGLLVGGGLAALGVLAMGDLHMAALSQGDMLGVRMPSTVHISLDAGSMLAAAITAFSTMLVGGLLPALRASRLPAVEAMRAD